VFAKKIIKYDKMWFQCQMKLCQMFRVINFTYGLSKYFNKIKKKSQNEDPEFQVRMLQLT
jgi:hypothetical protein